MTKISDIKSLVLMWPVPSSKTFAEDIGATPTAVASMISRNTIDQVYLWRILKAAKARKINLSAEQILRVVSNEREEAEAA